MEYEPEDLEGDPSIIRGTRTCPAYWRCDDCEYSEPVEN